MDSYQREIVDFLEDYGASAVSVHQNGGKHPKVEFDWRGKRIAYTIASSSSDVRAAANAVANLKRLLGEPVAEEKPEPRKLENMLPPAPDIPRYMGVLAMYHTGTSKGLAIRFYLPDKIVEWVHDRPMETERLAHDTWLIKSSYAGGRSPRLDGSRWMITAAPRMSAGFDKPISMSPAEYMIVEDTLRVRLLLDQIRPLSADYQARAQIRLANMRANAAPPPTSPPVAALTGRGLVNPGLLNADSNDGRRILTAIAEFEKLTPYRLVRIKDAGWAWQAPVIKLGEDT